LDVESVWQDNPFRGSVDGGHLPRDADLVIVGGGFFGMCCAYWLALRGRRPLVLERHAIAAGATGRNSGLIIPTTAQPYQDAIRGHGAGIARAVRETAVNGAALVARIVEDEGISCDYRSAGLVQLALNDHEAARHAEEISCCRADGFEASWLDRASLARQIDTPLGDEILGGMFLPGALANSVALTDGIAFAACRRGAVVRTKVQVTAVRTGRDGVRVETTAGPVRAAAAIVATSAWIADLVPRLQNVVRPVQGQLIATAPMPPAFPFGMAAQLTPGGEYWQQTPDGTIILGGCRRVAAAPPDPGMQRPQPQVHQALVDVLPRLFPALGPVRALRGWAGAMAFTPDQLPVVDEVTDSVWAIGGFNGHGMPFGASIGNLVANSVASGVRAPALAPFALDRPTLSTAGTHGV
jgi:gamma-glutamylputrescine oxidase